MPPGWLAGVLNYNPERGDIVWLDFAPQAGGETTDRRPGLVLSPLRFNVATGFAIVCPITNQAKGSPFEVPLPPGSGTTGVVIASEIRSLDWLARRAARKGAVSSALVEQVAAIITAIIC